MKLSYPRILKSNERGCLDTYNVDADFVLMQMLRGIAGIP